MKDALLIAQAAENAGPEWATRPAIGGGTVVRWDCLKTGLTQFSAVIEAGVPQFILDALAASMYRQARTKLLDQYGANPELDAMLKGWRDQVVENPELALRMMRGAFDTDNVNGVG